MSYMGIDMGGTNIRLALADCRGNILRRMKLGTYRGGRLPLENLLDAIGSFLAAGKGERPRRIGIACGGVIDAKTNRVRYSTKVIDRLDGCELGKIILEKTGIPVKVENDLKAAALGELKFGAGAEYANFAVVGVGTGISSGIILDRKLYRGATGAAGEIGHLVIAPKGPRCVCGKRGCLEAFCSGSGLRAFAIKAVERKKSRALAELCGNNPQALSAKSLFEAAKKGDPCSVKILNQAAERLAAAIAGLVVILNLEAVIFCGSVILGEPEYYDAVRSKIGKHILPAAQGEIAVMKTALGDATGLKGAIALAMLGG